MKRFFDIAKSVSFWLIVLALFLYAVANSDVSHIDALDLMMASA